MLNSLGLPTIVERGQRVFPLSGRSADVRDALVRRINSAQNIRVYYDSEAVSVLRAPAGHFVVEVLHSGQRLEMLEIVAGSVIIATGGLSYPATGSTGSGYRIAGRLGHTVTATTPSLTALVPYGYNFALAGLTLRNVSLSLVIDGGVVQSEFGELSFTKDGIEGALGFRVSRRAVKALEAGQKVEVAIDLKPAVTQAELKARVESAGNFR